MAFQYNGEHSITFTDESLPEGTDNRVLNSWTSFRMIPTSPPVINVYEPSMMITDIPGTNYVIDLSEARTGRVMGGRRTGSWEFILDTVRYFKPEIEHNESHYAYFIYNNIVRLLNGKWLTVVLDDRPSEEYDGRIYVGDFKIEENYPTVTLSYNLGIKGHARIGKG